MIWQDFIITTIVYMFVIVTIPLLIDVIKNRMSINLLTASATAIGNYILAYVFFTLDLWLSVISALFIASIWLALFIFSYQIKKQKKEL
jgi:hypothetical protein